MNQIAGVDGFNIMNNLRLVIIVAIFIAIIFAFLLNKILGSRKRVKRKHMKTANPYDDSSREERHAPGAVDDFFNMEEPMGKEKGKGGESAAESEVEIEDQPVVNYEKIEADLKAVGDEVTTKIERLILKVEAVEKEVLNKIEDVIDVKIQEASNKINDRISEAIRTQINSINPVLEERVNSLRKKEVPADILPYEDTVVPEEIKEKEQTDTIAPSGEIEEKISEGDVGESVDFDMQNVLEEEPVGMPSTEEPKELVEEKVEFEEKKERDSEVPVKDRDILEKFRLFVRCQLDAFGILPSDESKTVAEEKKERDSEVPVKDRDILEKFRLFVRYQLDAFGILPSDESKTVAEEKKERDLEVPSEVKKDVKVEEKEPIEVITSTGEIEEKISEGDVGEPADFDIDKLLEEEPVGMPSTEELKELVEENAEFEEKKERDFETPVEDSDILEKLAGSLQMDEDTFDILPSDEYKTVTEEKKERDLEVPFEVKKDVKVDEKEPIASITSTGDIKEKALEATKGEEAEEKKQSTGETVDFDIQEFLEELGSLPSEKDLEAEKDDTDLRSI